MNKQEFLDRISKLRITNFEIFNYDLLPETFKATDKIYIDCVTHGIFYQKACMHLSGHGCPECGRLKSDNNRALTTTEFITKSESKFGNKFDYSKTNYTRKGIELILICPFHKDFSIRPEAHMWSKHGCPKCDYEIPRKIKERKLIDLAKKIHDNKYNYDNVNYINSNTVSEIICPKHGSFWQSFYIHTKYGSICPKCSRENDRLTLTDFINKSRKIHGNNYDYSKVIYETNNSMINIICKKHGNFIQRASSHLAGNKCKKCFIENNRLSKEQFIDMSREVHGNKYDYSKVIYQGNKKPVEIICSKHGSFWKTPNSHTSSKSGCQLCIQSKGELAVEIFLQKYKIKYLREYKISPYNYRYDFYLPDLNIFIEFNGLQHYKPMDFFGGKKGYLKIKENDNIKKQIIKQNNGNFIIISYTHLNENSVEKELMYRLKSMYRYWFMIDEKLYVFKRSIDVINKFKIPMTVLIRDIPNEVEKISKNFSILF